MLNHKCIYCANKTISEEELHKRMLEYAKTVSKTKESAKEFLRKIGVKC